MFYMPRCIIRANTTFISFLQAEQKVQSKEFLSLLLLIILSSRRDVEEREMMKIVLNVMLRMCKNDNKMQNTVSNMFSSFYLIIVSSCHYACVSLVVVSLLFCCVGCRINCKILHYTQSWWQYLSFSFAILLKSRVCK